MKVHVNEKNLTIEVRSDITPDRSLNLLFSMKCINLVHYYCVLYAVKMRLRGFDVDPAIFSLPKEDNDVHTHVSEGDSCGCMDCQERDYQDDSGGLLS